MDVTHRCESCGTPVEVSLVDTTTWADAARGVRTRVWGRHDQCTGCGSTGRPKLVVNDTGILTQRVMQG
jgi:NAD-dependent dihydropyrimidine dehydrogenase PreA subunit